MKPFKFPKKYTNAKLTMSYFQTNKHVAIHLTDVILCIKCSHFWENLNFAYLLLPGHKFLVGKKKDRNSNNKCISNISKYKVIILIVVISYIQKCKICFLNV